MWGRILKPIPEQDEGFNPRKYLTPEEIKARKQYEEELTYRLDDNTWWENSLGKI